MSAVEPRLIRAITGTVKVTFIVSSGALMAMSALLYGHLHSYIFWERDTGTEKEEQVAFLCNFSKRPAETSYSALHSSHLNYSYVFPEGGRERWRPTEMRPTNTDINIVRNRD